MFEISVSYNNAVPLVIYTLARPIISLRREDWGHKTIVICLYQIRKVRDLVGLHACW